MLALVFRAKGVKSLLLSPGRRDVRFHYRISIRGPLSLGRIGAQGGFGAADKFLAELGLHKGIFMDNI